MARVRAALFGGTFDPVHRGHLEVARKVCELFELDEVIFVPAYIPPHKRDANISSAFHRFAMLALGTQQDQRFRISTIELDDPERPYAVETVSRFQLESDHDLRLFFLMGADSWAEITTWYQWQRLLQSCDLIVVTRPGYALHDESSQSDAQIIDLRGRQRDEVQTSLREKSGPTVFLSDGAGLNVSATAIRSAARENNFEELSRMVPESIANYIVKQKLYRK